MNHSKEIDYQIKPTILASISCMLQGSIQSLFAGMFPVNYDSCNWKMLSQYLQGPDREKIPPLTRAKLLHDAWNLAYAGELCFGIAMNMTLFLKEEKSHVVWEPVFTMIHHVGRRIEGLDVYFKFEVSKLFNRIKCMSLIHIKYHW